MTDVGITFKCAKCSELIKADQAYAGQEGNCPSCGASLIVPGVPPPPPPLPLQTPPRQPSLPPPAPASFTGLRSASTSGFAVTSLIMGILSIFPGPLFGGPLFGILAIVFSCIARSRIRKNPLQLTGTGLAIAGLVTGIVGLVFSLLVMIMLGALLTAIDTASKSMFSTLPK